MEYSFIDFLTLVGSLGLFLFGMKMMSEALQRVAGSRMRGILAAMTSNRFLAVFTGFLVTVIIQSSSATTVMVVSFVNAGLLNLTQSIGVIMGANIGTTVTGWIISLFGFKVKISAYALPLIGISLPLIFSKKTRRKTWGEFIIGFALLFMGLEALKSSVPNINQSPEALQFVENYTDLGFVSVLIFLGIGTILTIIIQSSSATMALTFVMCNQGWIPFSLAAAMIMGENIGTTITANIAASVGNTSAKQAAFVHFLFNIMGVIWMLFVFNPFVGAIDALVTKHGGISPSQDPAAIPIALSIFHTSFNVINVLIFVWFIPQFKTIVEKIIPAKEDDEEEFKLKYITTGLLSTPELSLFQARNEVQFFALHTKKMFSFVRKLFKTTDDAKFAKLYAKIEKYEMISDEVEVEIANYLSMVNQSKLSDLGRRQARAIMKIISDLESIGDSNFNLARTLDRMKERQITFGPEMVKKLELMFDFVDEALSVMADNLSQDPSHINYQKAMEIETEINAYRNQLKSEHLDNLKNNVYKYDTGLFYNDLFSECEKLADYVINVSEALNEINSN